MKIEKFFILKIFRRYSMHVNYKNPIRMSFQESIFIFLLRQTEKITHKVFKHSSMHMVMMMVKTEESVREKRIQKGEKRSDKNLRNFFQCFSCLSVPLLSIFSQNGTKWPKINERRQRTETEMRQWDSE